MKLADRIGDHLDVRRRAATAAADETRAGLNNAPRILGHVLRRAHVNLATAYIAW